MPIAVQNGPVKVFSQDDYKDVSYRVMAHIFEIHNEFGRFLTEFLFKEEIAARCAADGIPTEREVRIFVTHGTFEKEYSMDLLFSRGVMFEAKAVAALAPAHFSQALNYLLLAGMHHGTLVNLRTERVQFELVSTTLTPETRRQYVVDEDRWQSVNEQSSWMRQKMIDLLNDWGAFLGLDLYRDAITHFLGGMGAVVRKVYVCSGEQLLGEQEVRLLTDDTAFRFSAMTDSTDGMRIHLERFLAHTPLVHLQWVNLNRHRLEFVTLSK